MINEQTKGKAPLTKILPAALAALLLLMNACSNLFEPPEASSAKKGEGLFTLNIAGGNTAKTILPPQMSTADFKAYKLIFKSPGKETPVQRTNENLSNPVSLETGIWSLNVTAYRDSLMEKPSAEGSITGIVITNGETTPRSVELKPIIEAGATGTFEWNISFDALNVASVSLRVTPISANGTPERTYSWTPGDPSPWSSTVDDLNTGYYRVLFSMVSRSNPLQIMEIEEVLHIYRNMKSLFDYTEGGSGSTEAYYVTTGADSGEGSLRNGIINTEIGFIVIDKDRVHTISLDSEIEIDRPLMIRGNGVTITPSAAWPGDKQANMIYIDLDHDNPEPIEVTIDRVHFKDAKRGAVYNENGDLTLSSCIFSGNTSDTLGGAIQNNAELAAYGCTFYGNSANYGGAIYNDAGGTVYLRGNIFYANYANSSGPEVSGSGTTISLGDNASIGIGESDDIILTGIPISGETFRLFFRSEAANVIGTRPNYYPTVDFYGVDIPSTNAAAGAVQSIAEGFDDEASLLAAISNAEDGDTIRFSGSPGDVIELNSQVVIDKNLRIEGNGVTITKSESLETVNMLRIYNEIEDVDAYISGVAFRGNKGIVVITNNETLTVESCIFSNNTTPGSGAAINTSGTTVVRGCTFYMNSSGQSGAAILSSASLTLTGNLFYGNTENNLPELSEYYGGNVLRRPNDSEGTVNSSYNVVDVEFGTNYNNSGWNAMTGDTTFTGTGAPFDTMTFIPVSGLPSVVGDFPTTDFNGNPRTNHAPGAVDH